MDAGARFEFVEGATGDLSFMAEGPSLGSVFAAAGDALLAATVEGSKCVEMREVRSVVLEEPDLELLLMRFLNELIYLRDAEGLLLRPQNVDIDSGESARLTADLTGEPMDYTRHALLSEVKAATAHGLRVEKTAEGWIATATLDV